MRVKRDRAAAAVPEWEALRERAAAIKAHTLAHLDEYLEQFERNALAHGAQVHWARTPTSTTGSCSGSCSRRRARVVKSKSMLTEECGPQPYLENGGIEVVDTDLGERIVQLRREPPATSWCRRSTSRSGEIGEIFHEQLGTARGDRRSDHLAAAARSTCARFLAAEAGITGVNFAVAERGALVVCTNEGNADLGMALAPSTSRAWASRSSSRASRTSRCSCGCSRAARRAGDHRYTSHVHGPRVRRELHIVLVDNGRTRAARRRATSAALKCIRCGACMNTCPVYRRAADTATATPWPGRSARCSTPALDLERYAACRSRRRCADRAPAVCPVKIDLDAQLYRWRQRVVEAGHVPATKSVAMKASVRLFDHPRLFRIAGALARRGLRILPATALAPGGAAVGEHARVAGHPGAELSRVVSKESAGRRAMSVEAVSARDAILAAVRAARPPAVGRPEPLWPASRRAERPVARGPRSSPRRRRLARP